MNADPHLKGRIIQELDAANELETRLAGHDSVIVVRVRRSEQGNEAVAALLADDTPVAANCDAHSVERRLKPRDRGFRIKLRDQVGRALQICTENGEVFPLPRNPRIALRPGQPVRDHGTAGRAIEVAGLEGR